jgi:imidazolonepropionase-like amidohydrolase
MEQITLLCAKYVLCGPELRRVENGFVAIRGCRITDHGVLSSEVLAKYGHCPRVDCGELTLMPGLIDAHNHGTLDGHRLDRGARMCAPREDMLADAVENARRDLLSGVTAGRYMGDRDFVDFELARMQSAGEILAPRVFTCGLGMRGVRGSSHVAVPAEGVQEFRRISEENLRRGANHLKLFMTRGIPPVDGSPCEYFLAAEEVKAVTAIAHAAGRRVAVHCIGGAGMDICLENGVDIIDHVYCATGDQIARAAALDRWICLTPSIFDSPERLKLNPPENKQRIQLTRGIVDESMHMVVESGIRYAIGTDGYHGRLCDEPLYVKKLGASNLDVLKGITSNAAEMLGQSAIGAIEGGRFADIIAVEGDPLEDLTALQRVRLIMQNGKLIYNRI